MGPSPEESRAGVLAITAAEFQLSLRGGGACRFHLPEGKQLSLPHCLHCSLMRKRALCFKLSLHCLCNDVVNARNHLALEAK